MDPDEFEKRKKNLFKFDNAGNIIGLKKDAQAISAAIAAINIGNFQADNAKVLKQAQEQDKAYKTLKTAGVEAATAIELVKDQTLATAIATGSISSKKLKEISDLISRINKDIPAMETSRLLETKDGQIEVFEKGYSSALERFSVLEAAIDLSYSDKIKGLQDQIEASSKKISGMNEEIANYNYELEEIDEKEKEITKTFDDRLVALDQIREANAESVRQQKQQLTIAGALSQGDIAAAAAAVQEMRAQNAEAAQDRLQKGLEQAKENAILGVTNSLGLTRLQIEEKIKALKAQIRKEEEEVLKIKQKDLEDTNKIIDAEKEKLTVAKLTKEEWTKIKSGVDLAKTSGDAFDLAISNALTAAKALSKEWNEFKDKTVYLNIVQRYVSQAEAEEGVTTKEKTEKTDADKKTTSNQDTGSDALKTLSQSKTTAEINNSVKKAVASGSSASKIANTMVAPLIASGVSTASALSTARYTGQAIAWQQQQDAKAKIVKKSSGGMIPKRFAIGGYAMGTDTVPAMLTPGEFVMSKYAVNNAGIDNMKAINSGASIGDSVYNYQVSVNVKSDSNPDEIARVVMGQIKQVESKRLRGNRI
jgi:predicted phage tail protein